MERAFLSSNESNPEPKQTLSLPTAAILCLAVGAYVILVIVAVLIRYYLKTHHLSGKNCCGNGANYCSGCKCDSCQQCWTSFKAYLLSACRSCNNCCGAVQFKTCQCFQMYHCNHDCCTSCSKAIWPCCSGGPFCKCGRCNCTCACQLPQCNSINCCCFKIDISK